MYILKNKIKNFVFKEEKKTSGMLGDIKHYAPANKEWSDSVYTYNKNTTKLLPIANNVIIKLVKDYFNTYNIKLERNIRSPKLRKWMRRLSTARILISKAELKHTNDKVVITVYVYNRQEKYYINKLKKLSTLLRLKSSAINLKFSNMKLKLKTFTELLTPKKNMLMGSLSINNIIFTMYEHNNLARYIKRSLKDEMRYLYILQSMFINKFKFKSLYLPNLSNIIKGVYHKKIEFNFVNQKYFYLNSDILLQILAMKLRKRKNVVNVLTTTINSVNRFNLTKLEILRGANIKYLLEYNHNNNKQSVKIADDFKINSTDTINNKLKECFFLNKEKVTLSDLCNKKENICYVGLEDAVINSLKYKGLSGIRLEASGRLTRRITAARSVYKVKYLGNIRNLDSSYLGRSATILRGNLRSNLEFSKIKSKTRIGSFGLKGWINGI